MIHEIFEYCITYIRRAKTDLVVTITKTENQPRIVQSKV